MSKSINTFSFKILLLLAAPVFYKLAYAHGVSARDAGFIQQINEQAISIFIYLGAKHMVTGYDHCSISVGLYSFSID